MSKIEGEVGTWSHCGSTKPHASHYHTIVMIEGPYPDVKCLGTPEAAPDLKKLLADELRKHRAKSLRLGPLEDMTYIQSCHSGCTEVQGGNTGNRTVFSHDWEYNHQAEKIVELLEGLK